MATNRLTKRNTKPSEESEPLGMAGWMAKVFIKSPLSPILLLASLGLGVLGLIMTPRQEDPQISVPMVDVFVNYPGTSATQVASLVADPLERIMSEIQGVDHVYSASRRGQSMVTVQFDVGESMGDSLVKLYDKLQSNMDAIPPGVSHPLVKPKAIDDVPAVAITLWSDEVSDYPLRNLALDVLQRIKEVENTGPGFIVGGREDQIHIEISPAKLASFNISSLQIANTIKAANSEVRAGSYELGDRNLTVYSGRFLQSSKDVAQLIVGVHKGVPVYLSDVAKVFQGAADTRQIVTHSTGQSHKGDFPANGAAALTIAVAKKEGSNGVAVAREILEKVDSLKGQIIPDNVHVTVTRDYGATANDKVNELLFKLFVATAAVTLLVLVSLGVRPAIVVLAVVPVVILVTVFGAWLLDFTIDRVSLFALIFSIGILVDDAIVVVENIYRRWLEKGETLASTAIDAVREVGNPTILATFTVIAALLPMGFVGDMMGPYMAPIPALGSVAMLFSLFAAFAFTPWLTYKIRPTIEALKKAEEREERGKELVGGLYRKIMYGLWHNRFIGWLTISLILLAWALSCVMFYTNAVTVKMMPYDNKPEFNVVINMPSGTALPVTNGVAQRLSEMVRNKIPEVIDLQTYVGTASPYNFNGMVRHYYLRQESWHADIQIKLLHKNERVRSSHEIAVATRELLTPVARELGARVTVAEMPPGPPVLQTMVAEVYGPTSEIRREVAAHMVKVFEQAENVGDVDDYMEDEHAVLQFEIDLDKSMRLGITAQTINQTLAMSMGGYVVGDMKQGRSLEPTKIIMQVPYVDRAMPGRLNFLPVPAPNGSMVPLYALGRFVEMPNDPYVFHKDLRPVEYVIGESVGRLAAPIYGMFEIEELLMDYVTPDGVKMEGEWFSPPVNDSKSEFKWDGEWRVTFITFRDMGVAFGVAMLLIYVLVVWEFGNFRVPLIIISPIPLTLIGIMPGHWLLSAEFTATSMIGFIALAGIIVRNSILLVDFAQHEVAKGVEPREALAMAGQVRMRPIMLTALALMAGSSVILFDPIFQGMAVSLLFGVLVATLLTLIVIPMGCDTFRSSICSRMNKNGDGDGDGENKHEQTGFNEDPGTIRRLLLIPYYLIYSIVMAIFSGITSSLFKPKSMQDRSPPASGSQETVTGKPAPPAPAASHGTAEKDTESSATQPEKPETKEADDVDDQPNKKRNSRKKTGKRRGIRLKTDVNSPDDKEPKS